MKKVLTFFLAFAMAGGCLAQSAPSCEMTIDTLSGCAPFEVEFKFKSVNADTLKFYTGDGRVYWFTDTSEWNAPVRHIYEHAGVFVPVVELIQWVSQKDSNGNDQKVREMKLYVSTDTVKVLNCRKWKWFPKDAEWTYIMPSASGSEVQPFDFRVEGDTVIQGRNCVSTTFKFNFFNVANNIRNICFHESGDSVFYYNPIAKEFQLLYNFNLKKGDSYVICPSPEYPNDSIVVHIDSIREETVHVHLLRVQYVHTESISHADRPNSWQMGWGNKAVIYETIGSLNYFMPQETGWNDVFFSHLCQYIGDGIYYKRDPDENCDTVSGIFDAEMSGRLIISPNPASGQIRLRYEQGTLQSLQVFNAVGQEVLRQNLEGSEQVVNISSLAKGVYFLKIGTDRATVVRKIVVE